jgi:WhiB family redox-sensing transcriptional regulator
MTAHTTRMPDLRWYTDKHVDREWTLRAACRGEDPELWFPNQQDRHHPNTKTARAMRLTALAICLGCPVRKECLAYATAVDARFGIWGGLPEDDRARITGKRVHG